MNRGARCSDLGCEIEIGLSPMCRMGLFRSEMRKKLRLKSGETDDYIAQKQFIQFISLLDEMGRRDLFEVSYV